MSPTEQLSADLQLRIEREMHLLRAALLYADDIDLISPTAELLLDTVALQSMDDTSSLMRWISGLRPATRRWLNVDDEEPAYFLAVEHAQQPDPAAWLDQRETEWLSQAQTPEQITAIKAGLAQVRQWSNPDYTRPIFDEFKTQLEDLSGPHFSELKPFIDQGRIGLIPVGAGFESSGDYVSQSLVAALTKAASDPLRHLLTDEHTANLVQTLIDAGQVVIPSRAEGNARQAQAHYGFVEALPTLPLVPLETIAGIREDLSDALGRYRHDVATVTDTFKSGAYSPEIAADVHHAWLHHVSPAINDVRTALSANSRLKSFVASLGFTGSPILATGFVAHTFLSWMPTPEAIITGAGSNLLLAGTKGVHDEMKARKSAKTMRFYYLHQAETLASRRQ